MREAKIDEVFWSIQGEGLFIGIPQVFVRFYGCNTLCDFCDTPQSFYNTFTKERLLSKILEFKKPYSSISFTGGEPLCQAEFIEDFLKEYKEFFKIHFYLETNGTLFWALPRVIDYVDTIAMDFKLPSSTGRRAFWGEHEKFLKIAKKKNVFLKAIITNTTCGEDLLRMGEIVSEIDNKIPVVLQPATPFDYANNVDQKRLQGFKDILKETLERVEIIPQIHKLIGVK